MSEPSAAASKPIPAAAGSDRAAGYDAMRNPQHWTEGLADTARDSLPCRQAKAPDAPYTTWLEASVWARGYNDCRKALHNDLGTLVALVERLAAGRWDHLPTKDVEAFVRLREVARA